VDSNNLFVESSVGGKRRLMLERIKIGRIKNRVIRLLGFEARQRARLFGDLAPMVPPLWMMFDGPRNLEVFKENGEEFLKIYRDVRGHASWLGGPAA
jgi:hypothetical protein